MAVVATAPGIANGMLESPKSCTYPRQSSKTHANVNSRFDVDIIDIRQDCNRVTVSLKDDIFSMLQPASGPRQMPTLLLYNEKGLQLFEAVRMILISGHHLLTYLH